MLSNRDLFGTFVSVRYGQVSLMERCPLKQVLLCIVLLHYSASWRTINYYIVIVTDRYTVASNIPTMKSCAILQT